VTGHALTAADRKLVTAGLELIAERSDVASVAAIIRTADGETFAAVDVRSDVGGACAEVAALGRALAESSSRPELVVAARVGGVVTPCGGCRQVLSDLFPDILAVAAVDGILVKLPMEALLPLP